MVFGSYEKLGEMYYVLIGRNIDIKLVGEEKFRVDVDVVMSDKFLAWVIALGGEVKVVAPEGAVEKIREIKKSL